MRARILAIAAAALLAAGAASGAAEEGRPFALDGSVASRPFARYTDSSVPAAAGFTSGSATSLGLELVVPGTRVRAAASVEATALTGAAAADAWAAAPLNPPDLLLVPAYNAGAASPSALLEARIRTLYAKLDLEWVSLTAGRQVVNFLRGALWSPTDVFTELDLSGVSPVRRGSDALRLSLPLGDTGGLDLVAANGGAGGGDVANGRYSARLGLFAAGIDGAVLAFRDGNAGAWSAGGDFKADLGASWNGEALWTRSDSGSSYLRAAGGADWSFGDAVVAAEYYYDGGGPAADLNALGTHNLYGALSWKATELLSFTAAWAGCLASERGWATVAASIDAAQGAALLCYFKGAYSASASAPIPFLAELGASLTLKF